MIDLIFLSSPHNRSFLNRFPQKVITFSFFILKVRTIDGFLLRLKTIARRPNIKQISIIFVVWELNNLARFLWCYESTARAFTQFYVHFDCGGHTTANWIAKNQIAIIYMYVYRSILVYFIYSSKYMQSDRTYAVPAEKEIHLKSDVLYLTNDKH